MRVHSLASLVVLAITIMCLLPVELPAGQLIRFDGKIEVDPAADFKVIPRDFCITADGIFIFPDYGAGNVKLLYREGNTLNFLKNLGEKYGKEHFSRPMYCLYKNLHTISLLGILDYGAKYLFIFEQKGKAEFEKYKTVHCPGLGYDIEFISESKQIVVSGYTIDKDGNPYDLYAINIGDKKNKTYYLLPSHRKYYMDSPEDYQREYFVKQSLPAIGKQAYCDVSNNNVFYAWQGELKFIRIHLETKKINVFGNALLRKAESKKRLADTYKEEVEKKKPKFGKVLELRKERSYVKDIFAIKSYVLLVYQPGNTSSMRLQVYTQGGQFKNDIKIPGLPGMPMCFDKTNGELYSLSKSNGNGTFSILKYKISLK